jgi:hypothetical protein
MGKTRPTKPKGNGKAASDKKPTGCYVLSLSVKNVRCFGEKQTLDCSDGEGRPRQWTVILGDNGTGKTTLLYTLAFYTFRHWTSDDPLFIRNDRLQSEFAVAVGKGSIASQLAEIGTATTTGRVERSGSSAHQEIWIDHDFQTSKSSIYRLLPFCYGAARSPIGDRSSDAGRDFNFDRLFVSSPLRNPERWLLDLDYSAQQNGSGQSALKSQVDELLRKVLPGVEAIDFLPGIGPVPKPRVVFKTDFGWVPLRQLGHGYQTMIAWVVDFVSRMVERYPDSPNPLAEPAVCLVDEIDLHLHPVWQRKVIGYLSDRFPNTQFIVTAHSPLVVQAAAAADANIAVLVRSDKPGPDGHHFVEIKNNPEDVRNWRLDQILTSDLFGNLDLRSAETEKLFARKQELYAKPKRTKADEADLARIEAQIDALPVGDSANFARELDLLQRATNELKASRKP